MIHCFTLSSVSLARKHPKALSIGTILQIVASYMKILIPRERSENPDLYRIFCRFYRKKIFEGKAPIMRYRVHFG